MKINELRGLVKILVSDHPGIYSKTVEAQEMFYNAILDVLAEQERRIGEVERKEEYMAEHYSDRLTKLHDRIMTLEKMVYGPKPAMPAPAPDPPRSRHACHKCGKAIDGDVLVKYEHMDSLDGCSAKSAVSDPPKDMSRSEMLEDATKRFGGGMKYRNLSDDKSNPPKVATVEEQIKKRVEETTQPVPDPVKEVTFDEMRGIFKYDNSAPDPRALDVEVAKVLGEDVRKANCHDAAYHGIAEGEWFIKKDCWISKIRPYSRDMQAAIDAFEQSDGCSAIWTINGIDLHWMGGFSYHIDYMNAANLCRAIVAYARSRGE